MLPINLTKEQIDGFRRMASGAITVLAPSLKPGEPIAFSEFQYRKIAGLLGTEGSGREVEAYVRMELEVWQHEPIRSAFLKTLLGVVLRELELLEIVDVKKMQRKYRLQAEVAAFDADTGRSDITMPIEEFLEDLRAVSRPSAFKR